MSYGDAEYVKTLRQAQDAGSQRRVDVWMNLLMERAEKHFLSYDQHQLAIAGTRWAFTTGRIPGMRKWYYSLSLAELLDLLAEIILQGYTWANGKNMEDVATYLRTIHVKETWDADTWTMHRERIA